MKVINDIGMVHQINIIKGLFRDHEIDPMTFEQAIAGTSTDSLTISPYILNQVINNIIEDNHKVRVNITQSENQTITFPDGIVAVSPAFLKDFGEEEPNVSSFDGYLVCQITAILVPDTGYVSGGLVISGDILDSADINTYGDIRKKITIPLGGTLNISATPARLEGDRFIVLNQLPSDFPAGDNGENLPYITYTDSDSQTQTEYFSTEEDVYVELPENTVVTFGGDGYSGDQYTITYEDGDGTAITSGDTITVSDDTEIDCTVTKNYSIRTVSFTDGTDPVSVYYILGIYDGQGIEVAPSVMNTGSSVEIHGEEGYTYTIRIEIPSGYVGEGTTVTETGTIGADDDSDTVTLNLVPLAPQVTVTYSNGNFIITNTGNAPLNNLTIECTDTNDTWTLNSLGVGDSETLQVAGDLSNVNSATISVSAGYSSASTYTDTLTVSLPPKYGVRVNFVDLNGRAMSAAYSAYINGTQVDSGNASSVHLLGEYGSSYRVEITSPQGYTANQPVVSGTIPAREVIHTVIFNENPEPYFHITCKDIREGEDEVITVTTNADATGTCYALIYRRGSFDQPIVTNTVAISDGSATITQSGIPAGDYTATVVYSGDSNYVQTEQSKQFSVSAINVPIS